MKYVIRCPYCGTTYNVATDESDVTFMCKSCGGQNSIKDAIEKKEDLSLEMQEMLKQARLKAAWDKEIERNHNTIDEDELPIEPSQEELDRADRKMAGIIIALLIFLFLAVMFYAGV